MCPDGIKIVPYYDRSDVVSASVGTVSKALVEGAILFNHLILLLNSFRGSFRRFAGPAFVAACDIFGDETCGISTNLMSLGGLAILSA
jgi:cobalt-zinc-cadmium resistance protein CzcA